MKWYKKIHHKKEELFGKNLIGSDLQIKNKTKEWEFLVDPKYSNRETGEAQEYVGNFLSPKKTFLFSVFLFCSFLIIFSRLFYLQILQGDRFRSLAEGNRLRVITTKAQRGLVYDQKKQILVQNIPGFVVSLDPNLIPRDPITKQVQDSYFDRLSLFLSAPREELLQKFKDESKKGIAVIVAENLDYEKAILLFLHEKEFPGMTLEAIGFRKYYPNIQEGELYPQSLSHILGYVGLLNNEEFQELKNNNNTTYHPTDVIGKAGIEKQYETLLKGINGEKRVEVDALGREKKVFSNTEALSGKNLFLSLNLSLQQNVQNILLKHLEKNKKTRAVAIVMDPQNGEILAMVSTPMYDNNLFSPRVQSKDYQKLVEDPDRPLFHRAVSGVYPSGSTIKPVIAFGALEEGIIDTKTSVLSTGGLRIGKWFFPDWRAGGHGSTDVFDAIAESVNTFFYLIGGGSENFTGLGVERIKIYMELFGLGKKLGIDLPGEADGLVPTPAWKKEIKNEPWYIGDTYHMAIGQGDLLVTPLQIAAFTVAFANFGTLYEPHLVRGYGSDSEIESPTKNNYTIQKFSPKNIEIIRKAMRETVIRGSARGLLTLPVTSAGKTGTAQWHSEKSTHAWFTSFAPYENPEIVVTVLVEEGGGGERVALPIAYDIFDWYFRDHTK